MGQVAPIIATVGQVVGLAVSAKAVYDSVTGEVPEAYDPNAQSPQSRLDRGFRGYIQSLADVAPSYTERYAAKIRRGYEEWEAKQEEPIR